MLRTLCFRGLLITGHYAATVDHELVLDSAVVNLGPISFQTRSINGKIPGEVIRVRPGDILRVNFINRLQNNTYKLLRDAVDDIDCTQTNCTRQFTPYEHPNSTNLHTHGLHVSPKQPSDDVLHTVIPPGGRYTYTYQIPKNHMVRELQFTS